MYSVKTKSSIQLQVCLDIASIFPSLVFVKKKKNTAKLKKKKAFQCKFVVIVEGFAREVSLEKRLEFLLVHSRLFNCDLR